MIEVDAVALSDPLPPRAFCRSVKSLAPPRREEIERFRFWPDAHRSLVAELLARAVIGRRLGRPNAEIAFVRGPNGKPRLERAGGFEFNLSHSGRWIVCASAFAPVGVDVERIGSFAWEDVEDALSPEERTRLDPAADSAWREAFTVLWTAKESYLKALGVGLEVPPSELTVEVDGDGGLRLRRGGRRVTDAFLRAYEIDAEHRLAVCSVSEPPPEVLTMRTIEEVIGAFEKDGHEETVCA